MDIKEIYQKYKNNELNSNEIRNIKKVKPVLSNSDVRFLENIISKSKKYSREEVINAIIVYAYWEPDNSILYARKKGIFRYRMSSINNNTQYYIQNILKGKEEFKLSPESIEYLIIKDNCIWIQKFYLKIDKNINEFILKHHQMRIRKKVEGGNLESTLFRELIVYMELLFSNSDYTYIQTANNKNIITGYSREEIGTAISYLIYKYDELIGISETINYWADTHFIYSKEIERLILMSCKILQLQEWELMVDYFGYNILVDGNKYTILNNISNMEKSIRMGYAKTEIQEMLFYSRAASNDEDVMSLYKVSELLIDNVKDKIIEKVNQGILSRYRLYLYSAFVEFMKEKQDKDKVYEFFKEENQVLEYMEKELVSLSHYLVNKKITEHATLGDILIFQRLFTIIVYIYKKVFEQEKDKHIIAATIGPVLEYKDFFGMVNLVMNSIEKTEELIDLFSYNKKYKVELQYTPLIRSGSKVYFSSGIIAMSNMIRNAICYSHMIKNQTVNSDEMELMVKHCAAIFEVCTENYIVNENLKFKYKGKSGEIDILVISDTFILIIECKAPLTPTNNFELRSEYEHILKAKKQLDLSESAFRDIGFRKKYLQGLGVNNLDRDIKTCILLGNRIFTGYSDLKHPIRCFHELKMILTQGEISSPIGTWRLWKNEKYCSDDLIKFLSEEDSFVIKHQAALVEREEEMNCSGTKVVFKTYSYNSSIAHEIIAKSEFKI